MTEVVDYVEALTSTRPVTVRRRVLWSECDPAQVVYTGRFFDYLASCHVWFLRAVLNAGGTPLTAAGLGTPMKAVSLEFHRMLRPDDWFEMVWRVTAVRTRTFDAEVAARTLDGVPVFTGRLSPILVDQATQRGVPIPAAVRVLLENYRSGQSLVEGG